MEIRVNYINTYIQCALNKQDSIYPFPLSQPLTMASLQTVNLKKVSNVTISCSICISNLFCSANYLQVLPILIQIERYSYSLWLNNIFFCTKTIFFFIQSFVCGHIV